VLKVRDAREIPGRVRITIPDTSRGALLWIGLLLLWAVSGALARACGLRLTPNNTFRFIGRESLPFGIAFALFNSYFEERFVAGYLVESLENHGPTAAVAASALARFLYHTYQGWIAVISVLPMGVLFGIEYWRKRNLYPLMLAHSAVNILILYRSAA
jgi:membrane protease YdiL (CAAX protease family)